MAELTKEECSILIQNGAKMIQTEALSIQDFDDMNDVEVGVDIIRGALNRLEIWVKEYRKL